MTLAYLSPSALNKSCLDSSSLKCNVLNIQFTHFVLLFTRLVQHQNSNRIVHELYCIFQLSACHISLRGMLLLLIWLTASICCVVTEEARRRTGRSPDTWERLSSLTQRKRRWPQTPCLSLHCSITSSSHVS